MNKRSNKKIPAPLLIPIFIAVLFFIFTYSPVHAQGTQTNNPPLPQSPYLTEYENFIVAINPFSPDPDTVFEAYIVADFPITKHSQVLWFFNGVQMLASTSTPPGKIYLAAPNETSQKILIQAQMNIGGKAITKRAETYTSSGSLLSDAKKIEEQLKTKLEETILQAKKQEEQIYGKRKRNQIFSIVADNKNPGPYEPVNLTIESGSLDTNRVFVYWSVNGTKTKEGTGEKVLSVKTDGIGSQKTIRASITDSDGAVYSDEIIISPFKINLYWWANTIVPHWYKGKALPSVGSSVRVSAFVPTGVAQPQNFIYRWLLNDTPKYNASGMNRQTFSFIPTLESYGDLVTLRVESGDKTISAEVPLTLFTVNPELFFCIVDILAGCVKGARETIAKSQSELEVRAIPFFFWKDDARLINYQWRLNGRAVPPSKPDPSPWILSLKNIPPALKGKINITADAKSTISKKSAYGSFVINVQ